MANQWSSFTTRPWKGRSCTPGNDLVAIVLPGPARAGQKINLEFVYGGEVLAEAGGGLLYVGARGTWYPNRGMAMADFDLEFRISARMDAGGDGETDAGCRCDNPKTTGSRWPVLYRSGRFLWRDLTWASTKKPRRKRGRARGGVRHERGRARFPDGASASDRAGPCRSGFPDTARNRTEPPIPGAERADGSRVCGPCDSILC